MIASTRAAASRSARSAASGAWGGGRSSPTLPGPSCTGNAATARTPRGGRREGRTVTRDVALPPAAPPLRGAAARDADRHGRRAAPALGRVLPGPGQAAVGPGAASRGGALGLAGGRGVLLGL